MGTRRVPMATTGSVVAIVLGLALSAGAPAAAAQTAGEPLSKTCRVTRPDDVELQKIAPFKVFDNLYYVGPCYVSVWLVTTPQGHILFDSAQEPYVDHVIGNIKKVGITFRDIKYIILSHGHLDHVGGAARLQELTGARVVAIAEDWTMIEALDGRASRRDPGRPNRVPKRDMVVRDGDTLTLGDQSLKFHQLPGHTPGVLMTEGITVRDGSRTYKAVVPAGGDGGPGLAGAEQFVKNASTLASIQGVQVVLQTHSWAEPDGYPGGGVLERGMRLRTRTPGDPHPFVDPDTWNQRAKATVERAAKNLAAERAKAGASSAAPAAPNVAPGSITAEDVPYPHPIGLVDPRFNRPWDDTDEAYTRNLASTWQTTRAAIARYVAHNPAAWNDEFEKYTRIRYARTLSAGWPRLAMVQALLSQVIYVDQVVNDWEHIQAPTLLFGGADDVLPGSAAVFQQRMTFVAERIPNGRGRLRLIPGLGHVPHLEAPEKTYPPLVAFLKEEARWILKGVTIMKRRMLVIHAGAIVTIAAAIVGAHLAHAQTRTAPRYEADVNWPKPLPNQWVLGGLGGTCVDAQGHVFILNRQDVLEGELNTGRLAPSIIEFDPQGNVVNAWGDPKLLDPRLHSCHVDTDNNIWIASAPSGMVQKYTHDGSRLLLQVGKKGAVDSSDGTVKGKPLNSNAAIFFMPSSIYVDRQTGEVYVSDGEGAGGNRRIAVLDASGRFLRQWQPQGMETVHCMTIGHDGLVYVCNRNGSKIHVFDKMGALKRTIDVPWTPVTPSPDGRAFGGSTVAIDFSPDGRHLFVINQNNARIDIVDRESGRIVGNFGRSGTFPGQFNQPHGIAVDANGNVYVAENRGRRIHKFRTAAR